MSKVIFFDIDGTLVTPQNHLPTSTKKAIKELQQAGHIPILATGRPPRMLEAIAEALEVPSFISLNGQYIVADGEHIHSNPLPTESITRLISTSYEHGDRAFLLTAEKIIGNTFMEELMDPEFLTFTYEHLSRVPVEAQFELFKRMTEKPLSKAKYKEEEVLSAYIHITEESDQLYQEAFPEFHITRATPLLGEASMKGSHKAAGMEKVLDYFDLDWKDTIAFGDSLNDIEMLEAADIGVAMGNGRDQLKAVADHVTADVEEDGIYKAVKELALI